MPLLGCNPLLARMDEEVAIALFVMGGLVAIVSIVAHQWRQHREAAYNARLKQLMVERGMNADEIVRVIHANPGKSDKFEAMRDFARCRTNDWEKFVRNAEKRA